MQSFAIGPGTALPGLFLEAMNEALILVTNDDGVRALGIEVLADALGELGEVYVVAPDQEQSATSHKQRRSHSLNIKDPLRARKNDERVYEVNGTPADCVYLAMAELLPRRPSLLVSGINQGPNLGDDVYRSGTVGGAREGCFWGVHSIAVSLAARSGHDFSHAAEFARRIAARVLEDGLPERSFLNVNVPPGPPAGVRVTVQGPPSDGSPPREGHAGGYYWPDEDRHRWVSNEPSDLGVVSSGRISVTLIQTDCTNHRLTGRLQGWVRDLDGRSQDEQPKAADAQER